MSHEPEVEYNEFAEHTKSAICALTRGGDGDDPFRVLCELADSTEWLFGEDLQYKLKAELANNSLSTDVSERLMSSPAAPMLLAYVVSSLLSFDLARRESDSIERFDTATKRKMVAESFSVAGKSGEKYRHAQSLAFLKGRFCSDLNWALRSDRFRASQLVLTESERKAIEKWALRELFIYEHREQYIYDDETHKTRMRKLRALVTDELESFHRDSVANPEELVIFPVAR